MTVSSINFGTNANSNFAQLLICGVCDKPSVQHTDDSFHDYIPYEVRTCDRAYDNAFEVTEALGDYYLHSRNSVTDGLVPFVDYEGTGASEITLSDYQHTLEDEADAILAPYYAEETALENWSDKHYNETTFAIDWWHSEPGKRINAGTYATPKGAETFPVWQSDNRRNCYIEGFGGYFSDTLVDLKLTEKYALRLLNVFNNKKGHMQCGGVEVIKNVDGTITAKCVNDKCPSSAFTVNPDDMTREDMEDFVLTVIRHGNNHAARWFTTRAEFYKIHQAHCADVSTCDKNAHFCVPAAV